MSHPVVDVHVHAIPPSLTQQVEAGAFEHISLIPPRSYCFPEMAPSPSGPPGLVDFPALSETAEAQGITTRLVGPWTDLLGYTLVGDTAATWTRAYNEALVAACDGWERLQPLGTIPLQHPDIAVAELEAARDMGCLGVMIGTDVPGGGLGSPSLDEVWAAAVELSMPALVHPTFLEIPAAWKRAGLKNAVGRAGTSAMAFTELIYAGVLDRHPDLALVAAHGGGGFVPLIARVVRNQELGWAETDVDVRVSVGRLYWDSVVLDPAFLVYLVDTVGADKVLMGSDYPFPWEPDPVGTVESAAFEEEQRAAILGGNARRLFGLPGA